ncbi:LOW QUALITY PROTEIN: hypothetical protein SORBI_3010G018200 [Sorghum bicolor]|uniref:DUF7378 domain-containing protein n=1 Tax=Sorghum bicolor TaxID=4558 RepID=C5Z381_SORBI|nr:LOW QUALITY PROTEIN: hypothetical protein SORBI_3010G018200 [Sorghum bicolor]
MATTPPPTKPVAVTTTIGQSLMSRPKKWVFAILIQLPPVVVNAACVLYAFPGGPSFFVSVPWRLALVLACCAYLNVPLLLLRGPIWGAKDLDLYLPRTPVAVVKKKTNVGMCVGAAAMGVACVAMVLHVKDTRVLAACTAVVATIIVGLVFFWVWLYRTYSGDDTSLDPTPSGDVARRLPV